eukprot:11168523-Lingulodinium_polyedra.AAC.1
MLASLVFNLQVLKELNIAEAAALHRGAMWAYRMAGDAFDGPAESWPSDAEVLGRTGRARPADVLRARRCAYFGRVVGHGPAALLALLQANAQRTG